jgi:hypothetical protein
MAFSPIMSMYKWQLERRPKIKLFKDRIQGFLKTTPSSFKSTSSFTVAVYGMLL